MGRKLATGRFDTREELEEFVWEHWVNTPRSVEQIAKAAQVSDSTVQKILKGNKPETVVYRDSR